jgi:hypothetical protein
LINLKLSTAQLCTLKRSDQERGRKERRGEARRGAEERGGEGKGEDKITEDKVETTFDFNYHISIFLIKNYPKSSLKLLSVVLFKDYRFNLII